MRSRVIRRATWSLSTNLLEVSIGHAFTIDALRWGIPETVRRYLETLSAL